MPDFPAEIVEAIATVLAKAYFAQGADEEDREVARSALGVIASALGDHAAQKILKHADAHEPRPGSATYLVWHRCLGIAARVATGAFLTEDEVKRQAAGALARGDLATCPAPEDQP